jgi:hypothetical protein
VQRLVIGVPARNESGTIADVVTSLEHGSLRLGEGIRSELVMAYQPGGDDTLDAWEGVAGRVPRTVLAAPAGELGKGRNVKRLILHALESESHLLLVDADLRTDPGANIPRFVDALGVHRAGMVLPLWCRPRGQGNSTDFLACPLLYATAGARIRQPLAGQMLLSSAMLQTLDVGALPDDYGVDIALTVHALHRGLPVEQVVVPFPGHEAGTNSVEIMRNVGETMLALLGAASSPPRRDVQWPERWWVGQPLPTPTSRTLAEVIERSVPPDDLGPAFALLEAPAHVVLDLWCERLAQALQRARAGECAASLVADLVVPFLLHAEYRRRLELDQDAAEAYLGTLCARLADVLV